jgi:hypothetical protein
MLMNISVECNFVSWHHIFIILAIKQSDVDDVREVLRYYKQYDDPIEAFRENQRKLQVHIPS